jgi:ABC-type glycerol-3-phosphate transport system substrate-binding protein
LGGSNLGVSSSSQNKDLAWEFVNFLMDPTRAVNHARAIGALPARLAGMDGLFERIPSAKEVFFSSFGYARRLPRMVELGSVEQILYKMSSRVLGQIRERSYNHKRLQTEINVANNDIKSLLSIHRYGTHVSREVA